MQTTRIRTLVLVAFWVVTFAHPIALVFFEPAILQTGTAELAFVLLSFGLMITWVELDASVRKYAGIRHLRPIIVFIAAIGIPVYVYRSRGLRGALLFMLRVALLSGASQALYFLPLGA